MPQALQKSVLMWFNIVSSPKQECNNIYIIYEYNYSQLEWTTSWLVHTTPWWILTLTTYAASNTSCREKYVKVSDSLLQPLMYHIMLGSKGQFFWDSCKVGIFYHRPRTLNSFASSNIIFLYNIGKSILRRKKVWYI